MKFRKVIALLMVTAMSALALAGCGSKGDKAPAGEETTDKVTDSATPVPGKTDEIVTLKWIQVGTGMPKNYDAWLKNINAYLGDKIGVNLDMEIIPWGDWDTRRNIIINSGEYFDILFTNSGSYNADVELGAFYDISDLVQTSAPDLYKYIPEAYWKAVQVKGKVYSVPTYKDSSMTNYFVWDTALAAKYDIDIDSIHSLAQLTDPLQKIKDGEGYAPYVLNKGGSNVILSVFDGMGAGLPVLGVRYDDAKAQVVSTIEQEEILAQLDILHDWYNKGIINADAPTLDERPSYVPIFTAQGWSQAAITTWGPSMGVEAKAVKFIDTIVSNDTVQGSLSSIYSGTKYAEKCLELLQIANLDSYVRDALYYGLEGDNFDYTAEGDIDKHNTEWPMAGYTQGSFFTVSQLAGEEFNQWDEVKELNDNATGSVLLGFSFDTSSVANEIANCKEVYKKFESELMTGAQEPRAFVKKIMGELDAAGFEKIQTEAQAQVDAFMNK